jgi:predicted aldo/keto reductase-like oxidoreductase
MAENLTATAKLGWVDAVMTSYNFRFMLQPELEKAVEACHKAGVGLIAMKSQGKPVWEIKTEADKWVLTEAEKKLTEQLRKRGLSLPQANIKVVLDKPWFSAVCVGMTEVSLLRDNVAVSLDKSKLTEAELDAFREYAKATCSGYCAGCSHICKKAVPDMPYTSEIMRYLMYYNSYGDKDRARELFARIPHKVRAGLTDIDYGAAEGICPQHIPIGRLMAEAGKILA